MKNLLKIIQIEYYIREMNLFQYHSISFINPIVFFQFFNNNSIVFFHNE